MKSFASTLGLAALCAAGIVGQAESAPLQPLRAPAAATEAETLVVPAHGSHCSTAWSNRRGWHSHCGYYYPSYRPYYYGYGPYYGYGYHRPGVVLKYRGHGRYKVKIR